MERERESEREKERERDGGIPDFPILYGHSVRWNGTVSINN